MYARTLPEKAMQLLPFLSRSCKNNRPQGGARRDLALVNDYTARALACGERSPERRCGRSLVLVQVRRLCSGQVPTGYAVPFAEVVGSSAYLSTRCSVAGPCATRRNGDFRGQVPAIDIRKYPNGWFRVCPRCSAHAIQRLSRFFYLINFLDDGGADSRARVNSSSWAFHSAAISFTRDESAEARSRCSLRSRARS